MKPFLFSTSHETIPRAYNLSVNSRQQHTIVSFESASDAFAFRDAAKAAGIPGRLRTIPRQISAGCGTAWDSPFGYHAEIEALIAHHGLLHEGVHLL